MSVNLIPSYGVSPCKDRKNCRNAIDKFSHRKHFLHFTVLKISYSAHGSPRRSGLHYKTDIWTLPFTGRVLFCFAYTTTSLYFRIHLLHLPETKKLPGAIVPQGVFTFYRNSIRLSELERRCYRPPFRLSACSSCHTLPARSRRGR